MKRKRSFILLKGVIVACTLLTTVGAATLLSSDLAFTKLVQPSLNTFLTKATLATNGADRWADDSDITLPTFDFSASETDAASISPLFESYYQSHDGANNLGTPLTVAFPTVYGWLQFFGSGALLLPIVSNHNPNTEDLLVDMIRNGIKDSDTGVVRLPLLQTLLAAGSQVPVGGDGSTLTYVDLRQATNPDLMPFAPTTRATATPTSLAVRQSTFIKGGIRLGKVVGHFIPAPFWDYINRTDVSPDGWQADFGAPLTEALSFTTVENGVTHQMQVQAFWRDALILDQTTADASAQPTIRRLDTGIAYLRTIGPPAVAVGFQPNAWTQADTALLDAPGTGHALAHVGGNYPLTLPGDTSWSAGTLWYRVQWSAPKHNATGWAVATSLTFSSPGNVPTWASLDILSPDLGAYLTNLGSNVGVSVYDLTRHSNYTYNANNQLMMASSAKVPIMLTFFDMIEQQGREPSDDEMNLLTTMIENSNNDSASALYYGEIGGAQGVANYMQKIGISGVNPNGDAWGYSTISPQAMVNLLTLLYTGKILTPSHRNLALSLMEQVEPDQQVGVGDTAPSGATVALKDGWVTDDNNFWVMNSSGIVTLGQETYIIAVYTQGLNSLDDGQAIARHVAGTVASQLL
ncbi:MAG TPA: serine hydrolase [Ktedonobacteraceae bacterium]|nr:serine hydrolase [Ktedonobacteraceae bacterium]